MESKKATTRRTLVERIEAIFQFIDLQNEVFPKSRLKEIGINPKTAEKWLKLIEYIQNQPKIRLIQTSHNTLIEKVEGKYQALMRKMIIDETVPFEERLQYVTDYLKSLYNRERSYSRRQVDDAKYLRKAYSETKTTDFDQDQFPIRELIQSGPGEDQGNIRGQEESSSLLFKAFGG